jgi:hypothetical protein
MPYLIRSTLLIATLAVLWSFCWFLDDGFLFQIPGVGGYFFQYGGQ